MIVPDRSPADGLRRKLYVIIFEADTRGGRAFDVLLIAAILSSVVAVMLESTPSFREEHGQLLRTAEWVFTVLFTVEYVTRLAVVRSPLSYAVSFFGVIDLLAILPGFVSAVLPGAQYLLVIRLVRVLRVFRVLKLLHHLGEAELLLRALRTARPKITVFLFSVATLCVLLGSVMYLVEGPERGFTSIPTSVYWSIVTLTTVGYGDISPSTPLGQALASVIMILGYSIIAIPTGIVSVELGRAERHAASTSVACPACGQSPHDGDARYCKRCGEELPPRADATP